MRPLTDREREIVRANIGLIASWLRKHPGLVPKDWRDDGFQIATLGLMRAVQTWDSSMGTLSTYAQRWIEAFVRRGWKLDVLDGRCGVHRPVNHRVSRARNAVWLNAPLPGTDGATGVDMLVARVPSSLDVAIENRLVRDIDRALDALPARESHAIRGRMRGRTLAEIGADHGVSREYVRQLGACGLRTIARRHGATASATANA